MRPKGNVLDVAFRQAATLLQKQTISFIHLFAISFRALIAHAHSASHTFRFFNVSISIFTSFMSVYKPSLSEPEIML
jgi:type III secretory pathway component EscS